MSAGITPDMQNKMWTYLAGLNLHRKIFDVIGSPTERVALERTGLLVSQYTLYVALT